MNKYRYAIGYIFCVALVSVIRAKLLLELSPIIVLLISSVLGCSYFHLIDYKESLNIYKKFFDKKILFLNLNLIVALMWFATYYSIYFSSAAIFVFEFFMVGGCLSILCRNNTLSLSNKSLSLPLIILILMPLFIYKAQCIGILLGILAGVLGFTYNMLSNKAALLLDLSASQILASRFWLLIALSTILVPMDFLTQITLRAFIITLFITVLSFVLQVWLNQKSVITIGGMESSYISSYAPALTFVIQGVLLGNWAFPILILSVLGTMCILCDSWIRENNNEKIFGLSRLTLIRK